MNATIERKLEQALTVRDLIAALEGLDQDAPVLLVCDFGDYHHTQQALPVCAVGDVNRERIQETGYSASGLELVADDGEFEPNSPPVVVLAMTEFE